MEPILKTIAREYSRRYNNLKNVCFIFPNKRCGVYLRKYFSDFGVLSEEMPHILTISNFVSQIAKKKEAGRIVQLFSLFNSYREINGENIELDFDSFRSWGEIVLNDFNTVDINMADPSEVFKNIKDYREISSNFLTDEQKEVMREYFGIETTDEASKFWKTFENPNTITDLQKKFLNLWQILAPLHKIFMRNLIEKKMGTSGSIYREAANIINQRGKKVLPYKKIVFVGFNALTEAERSIFKDLMCLEGEEGYDSYADFIWDSAGPILNNNEFSASRFVNYNLKLFPMPDWLTDAIEKDSDHSYPEIEIISAPSNTAQAKVAGEILKGYVSNEKRNDISNAEVGLILPDEGLLPNILYSLPENIGDINLTMGYSFRQTPLASFMSLLRRLYSTTREGNKSKNFYVRDLKLLLSHPYSYVLFPAEEIEQLLSYLNSRHKISISLIEIKEFLNEDSELLDFPDTKQGSDEFFSFIKNILDKLIEKFDLRDSETEINQDISQIEIYKSYLEELYTAIIEYNIQTSPSSILLMIDKLLSSEKIGFEGEPLSGLQVMGTLETRSLDFRHVIILSMNEGIMPRKANVSTFLPESLRKAYGLPPARYAEEIFGYYFFRLISRAEKVSLIYDGRTISGLRGGESRYILQVRQYWPKSKVKEENWQYRLQNREKKDSSIEKTEEIKEKINLYCDTSILSKNFSASALNNYRECQVKFFLQNVLNINSDPEHTDFPDAIAIGDILHNVMMELYLPKELQKELLKTPVVINKEFLDNILTHDSLILNLVEKSIQEIYFKNAGKNEAASGVMEILRDQIVELIKTIISYDRNLAPFNLYGCEISKNISVTLKSGKSVNFRFAIDRLDEIEIDGKRQLRIIDYKTGRRKRKAGSLEEMFEGGYGSDQIFQLFIYAWLLGKIGMEGWEDVVTEIYFVPDIINGERGLPEIEGKSVTSFRPFIEDFSYKLEQMIEGIFTEPVFRESKDPASCSYCNFRSFCSK